MKRSIKAIIAGQFLLPIALLIGCSIRINAPSLLYFLLLMAFPFIPPPTTRHISCELREKITRQFGFQRWDEAYSHQLVRLIFPEIIIFLLSIITYRLYKRKSSSSHQFTLTAGLLPAARFAFGEPLWGGDHVPDLSKVMQKSPNHLGMFVAPARTISEHLIRVLKRMKNSAWFTVCTEASGAVIICAGGIAHPNLVSLAYFGIFLVLANLWILKVSLRRQTRNRLFMALAVLSGIHIFCLYLYQFEFFQEFLDRRSIGARLTGLTAIYVTDCRDVRALVVNPDYRFSFLLQFIVLSMLYKICVKEICDYHRSSFELVVKERITPRGSMIRAEIRRSNFIRRSVSPEKPETVKQCWQNEERLEIIDDDQKNFQENIIQGGKDDTRNNADRMESEKMGKTNEAERTRGKIMATPMEQLKQKVETYGISIIELKRKLGAKRELAKRFVRTVRQYSYVGCLVVMMTWSVTYHSWMTFVLLLLACIIWMVPNPRQFCLRITPYLVCYAEVLLIFQYIYGLDLSEDELPSESIPVLHQIGFIKPNRYPAWIHLFIKTSYTFVFWLTLKSYLEERRSGTGPALPDVETGRNTSTAIESADGISGQTDQRLVVPQIQGSKRSLRLASVTEQLARRQTLLAEMWRWFRGRISQLWLIICCVVLLLISIRQPVVGYKIIYMGFLLTFINLLLISFRLWRKSLKYYWTLMIVYCMGVLTLIYTYQFRKFPEMWHFGTGWSYDVLASLGLEQYSSGELLMKLMTPISFLICTVIQLKFFHKKLIEKTEALEKALRLAEEQVPRKNESSKFLNTSRTADIAEINESDEMEDHLEDDSFKDGRVPPERQKRSTGGMSLKKTIEVDLAHLLTSGYGAVKSFLCGNRHQIIQVIWRLLDMHMFKAIALQMMMISIGEVSAIHSPYPIFVAVLLPLERSRRLVYKLASIWTSIIILVKMIFQMKFINPADGFVNCSTVPGIIGTIYRRPFPYAENRTIDPSEWAGFKKSDTVSILLRPYFVLLGLLLVQEFVRMRQTFQQIIKKKRLPPRGVLFDHITRREADDGFIHCGMYFANYFFYKFGLEICFVTTVINIGLRCDFVAFLYGIWFFVLLNQCRKRTARLWRFYVVFLSILLPLQYSICVGVPPSMCTSYPWSFINHSMLEWLYLPDFMVPPNVIKLGADAVQLLLACCQWRVFEIESSPDVFHYPGGNNSELLEPLKMGSFKTGLKIAFDTCRVLEEGRMQARKSAYEDPVADFITYPKSYLDLLKIVIFQHLYWVTLTIVFVAGVSRVTLFAMGYVVAGFIFLWVGNDLFMKPLAFGLRLWNTLILYNAIVILIKVSMQVIGCVFLDDLYKRHCWILQLFGIACLRSRFDPAKTFDEKILADCKVPTAEAGIVFDGLCFCFLLLQRRIISSRYFIHVVTEFKAQHVFANRGAELIHKIRSKQIWERQARERELVCKIKQKMEKIREAQLKITAGDPDNALEGSSKQADEQLDPVECHDILALTNRTNTRDRRKFALVPVVEEPTITPTSSPAADHPETIETRDWLSPTSVFNESMVASFHKSVTFSPSLIHRETEDVVQSLNPRSPDDVSEMDQPSGATTTGSHSGHESTSQTDRKDSEKVGIDMRPFGFMNEGRRAEITAPRGKRLSVGFIMPTDTASGSSSSSITSPHTEYSNIDHLELIDDTVPDTDQPLPTGRTERSISAVLENAPDFLTSVLDQHDRYRASINVDLDADDAVWDLELQDELDSFVPESEEDRRKGLGPLQLLNVAFKKGDIKAAVDDAKEIEAQEEELKKQMTATFGRVEKKAIKEAMKKRVSTKILPDFEEETFDAGQVSADVAMAMLKRRSSSRATSSMDEGSHASYDDDDETEEDADTPIAEETAPSSFSESPEPQVEKDFRTLLAESYLISCLLAVWSALVEFLNNIITFLKLFLNGVLESSIAWLLKISREYRYVAHALTEEKKGFKSEKNLAVLINRGPSLLKTSMYRKAARRRYGSAYERRKHGRGLSFYDRKLAEEEAKKFNKDRSVFVRLLAATYYVLLSRSELFCYLMMVLTHMASASLITMPLPVMAFVWGTLSVPKPKREFWIAVITYTEAIVIIKYVFQFGFFPWNKGEPPPSPFFPPRILGIERQDKYAAWELALLMMLFFHRSRSKTQGLWKERHETDAESVCSQQSSSRGAASRRVSSVCSVAFRHKTLELVMPPSIAEEDYSRQHSRLEEVSESVDDNGEDEPARRPRSTVGRLRVHYRKAKERWKKVKLRKWLQVRGAAMANFFKILVNPRFRCSVDVYALMFLCDFVCFVIVIFGYSAFGTETASGGIASYFEENKIPRSFVAMLVVQFVLIIIDRALFLRKHLLGKVIYQIGLVLFVHIWMFFILPAVTERQFVSSTPAKLWYFVKCIYFCLSAWQIRSGYPTRVLGNMLTKQYNYMNMMLFKGFMMIPFLFELRALMDWIWTDTSMSLSDWLKLEDIYANIYLIKCERRVEEDYPTPRGVKRRPLLKYGCGGALLFLMILVIWFPLVLFSLANTVGWRILPVDVTLQLTIGTYPPLFYARAPAGSILTMSESEYSSLQYDYRHSKVATAYMSDYSATDVVQVTLPGYSDTVWGISPHSRRSLVRELESRKPIPLKFEWHFARAADVLGQTNIVSDESVVLLDERSHIRAQLLAALSTTGTSTHLVQVPHLYPRYIKVPGKGKAAPVNALMPSNENADIHTAFTNATLHLSRTEKEEYWKVSTVTKGSKEASKSQEEIEMIGFVDKVFPPTFNMIAGGGIIGFYIGLVLVVGKFIRSLVTGSMSRIMFEDLPNVDRILQLCLDIFLVREAGELALEEDLFAKLIFIYRSPATLIKWTKLKKT